MRWWERQIGGKTRGRIIALLRRKERTVEEVASDLGVTNNAARLQLQLLAREGIVRDSGTRPHEGAGKPASLYSVSEDAEASLSAAYAPVLVALLESMGDKLERNTMHELLRDAGRRLAPADLKKATPDARVRAAASLLRALGAEIDVEKTDKGFQLRGYACPLAAAVRAEPDTCLAIEKLVATIVGEPVRECCDRTNGARCRFDVTVRPA